MPAARPGAPSFALPVTASPRHARRGRRRARTWRAACGHRRWRGRSSRRTRRGAAVSPCSTRSWPIVPITVVRPRSLAPSSSGSSPRSMPSSVDLPLPLRPVTASRSPGTRSRSIGPSVKSPRRATAPASRATVLPGPGSRLEPELQLPGLERLLRQLVAVEQPLRLPHLRHQGMRSAAVGHAAARRGPGCGAR